MPKTKTTSPARSQGGATTPKRKKTRDSRSLCSPALSTASGRLTSLIDQFKDKNMESFALSPLNGRSVLNDNTEIEEPRRKSWWKKLDENSQDVMEVLEDNRLTVNNGIEDFIDIEGLSQEKKNYTLDLPESSDNESINSIVLPQRRLFTQKENQPQKTYGYLIDNRESLAKLHKTNTANIDKTVNVGTRELFQNTKRSKPIFPAALLNISPNKTAADKTRENLLADPKPQVRNIFGNRPANKRKNMFSDFIVSESEDEIPEIQPKVFGFQKKLEQRRISSISKGRDASPGSSITTDIEMDFRMLLPSSTMVENQLEDNMLADNTPIKRARLSKLSEAKESEAGTLQTNSTSNKTKQSNKSVASKNKSNTSPELRDKSLNSSRTTRSMLKNASKRDENVNTFVVKQDAKSNKSHRKSSKGNEFNVSLPKSDGDKQNTTLNKSQKQNKSRTRNSPKAIETEMEFEENVNDVSKNKSTNKSLPNTTATNKSVNEKERTVTLNVQDKGNETGSDEGIQNEQEDENNFTLEYENDDNEVVEEAEVQNDLNENQKDNTKKHNTVVLEKDSQETEINKSNSNKSSLTDKSLQQKPAKIVEESVQSQTEQYSADDNVDGNHEQETESVQNNDEEVMNDEIDEDADNRHEDMSDGKVIEENEQENEVEVNICQENEEEANKTEDNEEQVNTSQENDDDESQEEVANYESQEVENEESEEEEEEDNENEKEKEEGNESEEEEDGTSESQEVDAEVNERPEVEAEVNESREIEEEANESQEVEAEANDSQEIDKKANESQEVQEEANESQATEKEANESQEIEEEANEYQGVEEKANESQEVEAEVNESHEIDEEAHDSQVVKNDDAEEEHDEEMNEDGDEAANEASANESQEVENDEEESHDVSSEAESEEVEDDQQMDDSDEADKTIASDPEISDDNQADEMEVDGDEQQESDNESEQHEHESHEDRQIEEQNEIESSEGIEESPNVTHDTTGRHRTKHLDKSPELILHNKTNRIDSFTVKGRNTSVRKTKSMIKNLNIRPSLAPPRDSTGFSDGTRNSSAEGSGWDSHRVTRKTLRQTFGKDFTPRKSLRALVMEKSAKRQTEHMEMHSETVKFPLANSTEMPEDSNNYVEDIVESDHEVSRRTRQTTLEMYLQKMKEHNIERKLKMEAAVRNSLKNPVTNSLSLFKVPNKPAPRRAKPTQSKPKKQIKSIIPFDELPSEVIEDIKYKPPKRFQPSNASWITKRLYKYLENKLEVKYDYKARVRAEKLVETIYFFAKDLRRHHVAPTDAVDVLKHELARLEVVRTHFEFYEFFHEFMPREVRVKVVPDIVNKIALPRHGVYSAILRENTVHG